MGYREHPVHPSLRPHVAAAWSVRVGESGVHRVLPDGCIDLVAIPGEPVAVAGPATRHALVPSTAGAVVHGLRFRPGAAAALLGVAAHELRDTSVPLAELPGSHDPRMGPQRALLGRLDRARRIDPAVAEAAAALARDPSLTIGRLARGVAVSERHLRRRFADAIGYGPKRLARILRLQRLLAAAVGGRDPLAALALAAGYADQAHMTREVRGLSGLAPAALLAERGRFLQDDAPDAREDG